MENRQAHWENVYQTKSPNEVSWTQEIPKTSLEFIRGIENYRNKCIIDVGAGDSNLVDFLLSDGCQNITVLDISAKAIERAKTRLGALSDKVNWIVCDVVDFIPTQNFDIWHDRAAFHFLTQKHEIDSYKNTVANWVNGNLIIGTFSTEGPKKCSGLAICQYDAPKLASVFPYFNLQNSLTENHQTPFGTQQHFVFAQFLKKPEFSIKTNHLHIRTMKNHDVENFLDYRSNPEIVKFQSFDVMDLDRAQKFVEEHSQKRFGKLGEWVQYAIENLETREMIGDCAIKLDAFDAQIAEIGITVSHRHQKKGFAREALSGIVDFLFSNGDFHRIVELVDTQNAASIAMLESCGFRQEGHFVQSYFDNGVWTDEFQYAMNREDWHNLRR